MGFSVLCLCLCVIFASGSLSDGLVGHYPFNGNVDDVTEFSNHAINHGAAMDRDRFGNDNGAYKFIGGEYIQIPDSPRNRMNDADAFSVSIWVRFDDISSWQWVYDKGGVYSTVHNYALLYRTANSFGGPRTLFTYEDRRDKDWQVEGRTYFSRAPDPVLGNGQYYGDTNVVEGEWYHFGFTKSGKEYFFYKNGKQISHTTWTGLVNEVGNYDLFLGTGSGRYFGQRYLKGALDDFRLYNRVLSGVEMKSLFDEDLTQPECPATLDFTKKERSGVSTIISVDDSNCYSVTFGRRKGAFLTDKFDIVANGNGFFEDDKCGTTASKKWSVSKNCRISGDSWIYSTSQFCMSDLKNDCGIEGKDDGEHYKFSQFVRLEDSDGVFALYSVMFSWKQSVIGDTVSWTVQTEVPDPPSTELFVGCENQASGEDVDYCLVYVNNEGDQTVGTLPRICGKLKNSENLLGVKYEKIVKVENNDYEEKLNFGKFQQREKYFCLDDVEIPDLKFGKTKIRLYTTLIGEDEGRRDGDGDVSSEQLYGQADVTIVLKSSSSNTAGSSLVVGGVEFYVVFGGFGICVVCVVCALFVCVGMWIGAVQLGKWKKKNTEVTVLWEKKDDVTTPIESANEET